jgi:hypothetical protein
MNITYHEWLPIHLLFLLEQLRLMGEAYLPAVPQNEPQSNFLRLQTMITNLNI